MSPLRRRMIEDMQIRNLTTNTQRVYVAHLARFACYFRKSPDLLGPAEIRTYLIHLTRERRLAVVQSSSRSLPCGFSTLSR
jgi:integrase/recombinase XerD